MLLDAHERGFGAAAADVAVLLTEWGLGGNDPDLELRWRRWRADRFPSSRPETCGRMAPPAPHRSSGGRRPRSWESFRARFPRSRLAAEGSNRRKLAIGGRPGLPPLLRLFPNRQSVARNWGGRRSRVRRADLSAAAVDEGAILALFADRIETGHDGEFDPASGSVTPTLTVALARSASPLGRTHLPTRRRSNKRLWRDCVSMVSTCCRGTTAPFNCVTARRSRITSSLRLRRSMTRCFRTEQMRGRHRC